MTSDKFYSPKILLLIIVFVLISATANAWIFNREKKEKASENKINISLNSLKEKLSDGASDRKNKAGDKSKNQGYAEYKRWAIGIMASVYAIPAQDGNQYVGVEGVSGFLEHNLSEFFTVGFTQLNQSFTHLDGESKGDILHKHTAVYGGFRTWITNRSVVSVRLGIADSKVEYLGETEKGMTNYISVGFDYALAEDDSSRVGYRYVTLAGTNQESTRNIGMTAHGATFQVLF